MRQNNGTVYFKTAQTCILVWDFVCKTGVKRFTIAYLELRFVIVIKLKLRWNCNNV